ncbi:hypothetical protein PTTG_12701 [Puccinia triticina 1-1 BBBD Race 1]|uniref:Uncharacterized protein n=2 Tax=Puccinia triticina TaxID=208348 RepID=A0A180GT68_PUCT1|nr:uncharacterized protein PtA15_7A635 [Puccinia triticina]OAV95579.1 hypothetical protein PTTG_12701 [Puccinia triticina 1-1 BBBD Race 1]WAQ86906.1 hypothetical protein PtA15_7A635 [Puccinia triticina]WAR56775.1 hypothetical protein PtB15_7B625 [Puccinia triticina]
MHIRQLITVLGLCLASASAMMITDPVDRALQQLVMLMTPTDAPLDESPHFAGVVEALKHQESANTNEMKHFLHESVHPIMNNSMDKLAYVSAGYKGYQQTVGEFKAMGHHPDLVAKKLRLYRSAIYSNMKGIFERNKTYFTPENIEHLQGHLLRVFNPKAGVYHSANKDATIEEIFQHHAENAFRIEPDGIKEMSNSKINKELKKISEGTDLQPILIELSNHAHTAPPSHLHSTGHPVVVA